MAAIMSASAHLPAAR